jgi:hypothetical protein
MTPVVLISLPNLPYLLGTFDTARFRSWWRSAAFPDEIENIKKGFHIYGRTHLALAHRKDGRWAVYRSKNYGIDWERVFLAAVGEKIYDIVLITFGRAILNTSLGFYETVNAGTSWSLVLGLPSAPNAPAFCNIGGGDVLMCTDGRYIWRSANIARSWTMVCDMQTVLHGKTQVGNTRYLGPSVPCIAGANGRVVAGHGPFLVRSDDGGLIFKPVAYWETDPIQAPAILRPPADLVYNRIWSYLQLPERTISKAGYIITQILISSIDGPAGNDVVFVLKMNDLWPVRGNTELFAWTLKTWTSDPILQKNGHWKPIFQQHLTPTVDESHLCSYDVAVMGANYNDKLLFSAQTRIDSTGKPVPSLKYSTDGGENWTDINLDQIKIGDPTGGGIYGGSMMDDNFAKLTWSGPACNNYGSYNFVELYRRQCQSYELDAGVQKTSSKSYQVDAIACSTPTKTEELDVIIAIPKVTKPYEIDALAEGRGAKSYRIDRTLEGEATKDQELDAVVTADNHVDDMLDALVWANIKKHYHLGVLLKWKASSIYNIDTILVKNRLNERLSGIEREIVQFVDIDVPTIPYSPLDSRKETL